MIIDMLIIICAYLFSSISSIMPITPFCAPLNKIESRYFPNSDELKVRCRCCSGTTIHHYQNCDAVNRNKPSPSSMKWLDSEYEYSPAFLSTKRFLHNHYPVRTLKYSEEDSPKKSTIDDVRIAIREAMAESETFQRTLMTEMLMHRSRFQSKLFMPGMSVNDDFPSIAYSPTDSLYSTD